MRHMLRNTVMLVASIAVALAVAGRGVRATHAGKESAPRTRPQLVTDRSLERTGFQESAGYNGRYDLRTDFVMAYGIRRGIGDRLKRWTQAGYVPHLMTGIAWGNYQDYLQGKFDGRRHTDEGQIAAGGRPINHNPTVPYMVPTVAFSDYLQTGIRRAIDAGARAIHLEEPEFWADAGFSKAFQREWQIYFNAPWQPPDQSVDAQFRASQLKYYLYRRALDRVCSAMKEYSLVKYGRPVRFYVPTHSLINYTQWRIVSPESALVDLPGIDGYIAQVWTGTARTPNGYAGKVRERTFETAFLEYGIMQELVRGTGRRMWFLADPVEDNPRHDWEDYRRNYRATLVAQLLHPGVCHYEVSPWPNRVFNGRFPRGSKHPRTIPADYATTLAVLFNQLRDMDQPQVRWPETTEGVGVLLADSAMFQRAAPCFTEGLAKDETDRTRPTADEVRRWAGFYGLALPGLKHGIPVRPVQFDNITRLPGYLNDYRVLMLSYEFMKPLQPAVHLALAQWVHQGGALIYVGADTDPFHRVRQWWNRPPLSDTSPSAHLFKSLGLSKDAQQGAYPAGQGLVIVERQHPAALARSAAGAERLLTLIRQAVEHGGGKFVERNYLLLHRGPYVIAACLDESVNDEILDLKGKFVNLLDANLPVVDAVRVAPGQQAWLLDLDAVVGQPPLPLASAGRIESSRVDGRKLTYTTTSIEGITVVTRWLLPARPTAVTIAGKPCHDMTWDADSRTVLLRHAGSPAPLEVAISW